MPLAWASVRECPRACGVAAACGMSPDSAVHLCCTDALALRRWQANYRAVRLFVQALVSAEQTHRDPNAPGPNLGEPISGRSAAARESSILLRGHHGSATQKPHNHQHDDGAADQYSRHDLLVASSRGMNNRRAVTWATVLAPDAVGDRGG